MTTEPVRPRRLRRPSSIPELMRKRGMSDRDVCEVAGTTRSNLNVIKNGRSTPNILLALRIAAALRCTVEDCWPELAQRSRVAVERRRDALAGPLL